MATWDELISRIADDLDRSDLSTQIGVAINRAIAHYQSEETWFNTIGGNFTCVVGQEAYDSTGTLPSNIIRIDLVQLADSASNMWPLTPRTWDYLKTIQSNPTTSRGRPCDWSWYQEKLYLYPVPDVAYVGYLWYVKSYSDLTTGQSNDWTTEREALDLIESRATWWIASRILKDYERAGASKQEEADAFKALVARTNRQASRNTIRPYL